MSTFAVSAPSSSPRLTTPRLELRLATPAEAGLVVEYLLRNRAHLAPWEPEPGESFFTRAEWQERLRGLARDAEAGRQLRFHLFPRDGASRVIGAIGLMYVIRGALQSAQLGFSLDAAHQGRGLMREALEAVIGYAFGPFNLHRIEASHQPQNLRSAGLLRRLGFVPTGYARDYLYIAGGWRDHVLTALVNPAWRRDPGPLR